MAGPLVSDALWEIVEPLLPPEPPKPIGGRPGLPDRAVLSGILFVVRSGIPWQMLPQTLGYGSGMTCWRRLRDWEAAGVWERLHHELLNQLHDAGQIDWSRAYLDSASIAAEGGGDQTGPNATDRGRPTSTTAARSRRSSRRETYPALTGSDMCRPAQLCSPVRRGFRGTLTQEGSAKQLPVAVRGQPNVERSGFGRSDPGRSTAACPTC